MKYKTPDTQFYTVYGWTPQIFMLASPCTSMGFVNIFVFIWINRAYLSPTIDEGKVSVASLHSTQHTNVR